jgi:integrator complex subunit 2
LLEVLLCAWQQFVLHYHKSALTAEYRNSFILTMQSACVQKLIDVIPKQNLGKREEIDSAICEFLHSYWIENFMLIKLVHTQGYPKRLLNITVNGIGSLICTWDFIMDLVQGGTAKQQRFALQLAGYLSCKYPTQRLLEILRSCVQFIDDNLNLFSEDKALEKTLELYVKAFPSLSGRIKKLKRKLPKNFFWFGKDAMTLVR